MIIKIKDMYDLMSSPQIWQIANGNIEHEEEEGVLRKKHVGKTFNVSKTKETKPTYQHTDAIGYITYFHGWMISFIDKQILTIEEIVEKM